ncbi:MAG: hypothetical protein DRJ42_08545 [Deltaproteobacteria bacterium]|nr:MAG: hypothetical protein DRJ42_08545 [Deltaproteobacteria bacterium]
MSTQAHLEERILHLEGEGARRFDAPAFAMVERLLARAEDVPSGAAERLWSRAEHRLTELEHSFRSARDRASVQLDRLKELGGDADGRLTQAFEAGDTLAVAIAAARHRGTAQHPGRSRARAVRVRLVEAAAQRRLTTARPRKRGDGSGAALAKESDVELLELSELLYRRRFDAVSARQTVKRELETLPDIAGVYHAPSIATRALSRLEQLSPSYLRSRLAQVAAFDSVLSFVMAEAMKPEPTPVVVSDPSPDVGPAAAAEDDPAASGLQDEAQGEGEPDPERAQAQGETQEPAHGHLEGEGGEDVDEQAGIGIAGASEHAHEGDVSADDGHAPAE